MKIYMHNWPRALNCTLEVKRTLAYELARAILHYLWFLSFKQLSLFSTLLNSSLADGKLRRWILRLLRNLSKQAD